MKNESHENCPLKKLPSQLLCKIAKLTCTQTHDKKLQVKNKLQINIPPKRFDLYNSCFHIRSLALKAFR